MSHAFATPAALPVQHTIPSLSSVSTHPCFKRLPPRRRTSLRMVQDVTSQDVASQDVDSQDVASSPPLELPSYTEALSTFRDFFSVMPGAWNSERTYHYLSPNSPVPREESQTTFDVERLTTEQIKAVLASNRSFLPEDDSAEGFRVSFLTRMALQDELVRSGTNLAFVPDGGTSTLVLGNYYRDLGYEERAPVKARFLFDTERMELRMTTYYTKVVSVDEIRLINDKLRLRRIVNYKRPEEGEDLKDVLLVGFGVERKGEEKRLVS